MNDKAEEVKAEEVKAEVVGSEDRSGPMAIVALICGILSMLCCVVPVFGFILSIAAIVLGIIESKKIGRGESNAKGKGMAIAGIILGVVGVLAGITMFVILPIVGVSLGVFSEIFNPSYY